MANGGDTWRWRRWSRPASGPTSIYVIEPAEERQPAERARRVPFGFARALTPPPRGTGAGDVGRRGLNA